MASLLVATGMHEPAAATPRPKCMFLTFGWLLLLALLLGRDLWP
jgi:hypothetical protein